MGRVLVTGTRFWAVTRTLSPPMLGKFQEMLATGLSGKHGNKGGQETGERGRGGHVPGSLTPITADQLPPGPRAASACRRAEAQQQSLENARLLRDPSGARARRGEGRSHPAPTPR